MNVVDVQVEASLQHCSSNSSMVPSGRTWTSQGLHSWTRPFVTFHQAGRVWFRHWHDGSLLSLRPMATTKNSTLSLRVAFGLTRLVFV